MKKIPRILVVGSINMDMICTAKKLPSNGETVSGMTFSTAAGGKGANQAVQAARLGARVTMVGKVGCDAFGQELISQLAENGIDVSHVTVCNKASTGVADIQIETGDGKTDNRILVIPGANGEITEADVEFLLDEITEYDMVILQNEIPTEINLKVAEYASNKKIPIMLNPAPSREMPKELLGYVDYISPNEHEARDLTGVVIEDNATKEKAVSALLGMGVKNALITLGQDGCIFSDGEHILHSPCISYKKVVDPTAAGDSFIAAFCVAIASGKSIEGALRFANCTAGITVCGMGAQPSLPSLEEVLKVMDTLS